MELSIETKIKIARYIKAAAALELSAATDVYEEWQSARNDLKTCPEDKIRDYFSAQPQ